MNAPNSSGQAATTADPNAVVKAVGPANNALPAPDGPPRLPSRSTTSSQAIPAQPTPPPRQNKKPKVDQSDESSSKKKKKKGLDKINPF